MELELTAHEVIDGLHVTTRFVNNDCITEYHSFEDKRHRDNGPAIIIQIEKENNEYLEWWKEGKLVALFNKNKKAFLKSVDGTHENLYRIQVPEKWLGAEKKVSLKEIIVLN